MRKLAGVILGLLSLGILSAGAQESERRTLAEEVVKTLNIQKQHEATVEGIKRLFLDLVEQRRIQYEKGNTNMPVDVSSLTNRLVDIINKEYGWTKAKADYVTLYAEAYTEQELKDIVAFMKSPSGKLFLETGEERATRTQEITDQIAMQVLAKVKTMIAEEIEKAKASETDKRE